MKPPFAYYGGKTTLAQQIAAALPKHDHYVEPFAGSLAVLLAKEPSRMETVNDLDEKLMTFWRVLRDQPDALERVCRLTPHSRTELALAQEDTDDELEAARRVWVTLTQSRSHRLTDIGWKFRKKLDQTMADKTAVYASRIENAAERIRKVSLENRDALDVIRDYGTEPTVCIYADPPYLGETRSGTYRLEMKSAEQHETFAEACHAAKAAVVVSGYDSDLYTNLFAGWHRTDLKAPAALSGATNRVETLWSNRQLNITIQRDLFGGAA